MGLQPTDRSGTLRSPKDDLLQRLDELDRKVPIVLAGVSDTLKMVRKRAESLGPDETFALGMLVGLANQIERWLAE